MGNRRILIAVTLVVTCGLAFALTYLLLQSTQLAIIAFGAIVGVSILFANPFIGLVNYLLFLYIRPQDYMAGMQGMPIMLALGGATALLLVLHMAVKERHITITKTPMNMILAWFVAAIALSHMTRLYLPNLIAALKDFVPTVVMYFLITNLVVTRSRLKFVIRLIVFLTIILAAQGLVQFYTGTGFGGQEAYEGRIQAVGIFSDPNDLALALVIVLPYVFLKLVGRARGWEKILAAISMALLVYALYLTASRGGLLAFAVLMMLLFSRKYGKVPGMLAGGLILAVVLVLGPRMASISTDEASAYGRIQAWGLGLDLFEQFPLFGVGSGQYTEYHFRTAHNSFVLCAAELGMFGLVPWVMMIYLTIRNNHFISKHMGAGKGEDIAIYVDTIRYALIAFVLAAYFLSRTYSELLFILIALGACATQIFVKESGEEYKLIERRDLTHALLWTGLGWGVTKLFLFTAW